jgi:hypothetical protein
MRTLCIPCIWPPSYAGTAVDHRILASARTDAPHRVTFDGIDAGLVMHIGRHIVAVRVPARVGCGKWFAVGDLHVP